MSPKFYYFDVTIPNHLLRRTPIQPGTDVYGHTLEHFVIQELCAYLSYRSLNKPLTYWHTQDDKYEVDAVIGNAEVAVEVKSSANISSADAKGPRAFGEEYPQAKLIIVSQEERPCMLNHIEI